MYTLSSTGVSELEAEMGMGQIICVGLDPNTLRDPLSRVTGLSIVKK